MENNLSNEDKTVSHGYILQIHRIKLQNYIKCGLIASDIYLGDEIETDLQSKNKGFLIVSDGYIEKLDENQILIELILTDEEIDRLYRSKSVCYFDFPVPITRIKKVYAQNKTTVKHILKNIKTSEKGFLPENLFDVYMKNKDVIFARQEYSPLPDNISSIDYSDKSMKFNKRMGMFSFMKNTNVYYCSETGYISNYSDNYMSTLSKYLNLQLTEKSSNILEDLNKNEKFKELLYSDKQIDKEFIEDVCNGIEDEELKSIFSKQLEPNSTKKTLVLLLEKKAYIYYYISLIYYFKQKDANKSDNFKVQIEDYIPQGVAEISLAIMGIYLGYTRLRATEKYEIKDRVFKKIFGDEFNMKFKLDTKLDYLTIEAIYNYSFHTDVKTESFEYLNYPTKPKTIKLPVDKEFITWYEKDEKEYKEARYIKIKKKSFEDIAGSKFDKYGDEITLGKDHLLSFIAKYYEKLLSYSKNGRPTKPFSKKKELQEALKEEQDRSKQEELLKFFELDKK